MQNGGWKHAEASARRAVKYGAGIDTRLCLARASRERGDADSSAVELKFALALALDEHSKQSYFSDNETNIMKEKINILNINQVNQKINRLAWQVYENNFQQKEIVLIGIDKKGLFLAEKISEWLISVMDFLKIKEAHLVNHSMGDSIKSIVMISADQITTITTNENTKE